mmetsp:Transcript_65410/g.202624  ORF Transcript_65410/g.202624 Transcript_65410/m.202624 type:complete len:314 (+) Transcript_65410:1017-1958(+)
MVPGAGDLVRARGHGARGLRPRPIPVEVLPFHHSPLAPHGEADLEPVAGSALVLSIERSNASAVGGNDRRLLGVVRPSVDEPAVAVEGVIRTGHGRTPRRWSYPLVAREEDPAGIAVEENLEALPPVVSHHHGGRVHPLAVRVHALGLPAVPGSDDLVAALRRHVVVELPAALRPEDDLLPLERRLGEDAGHLVVDLAERDAVAVRPGQTAVRDANVGTGEAVLHDLGGDVGGPVADLDVKVGVEQPEVHLGEAGPPVHARQHPEDGREAHGLELMAKVGLRAEHGDGGRLQHAGQALRPQSLGGGRRLQRIV